MDKVLKIWNALPPNKRQEVINKVGNNLKKCLAYIRKGKLK